MRATNGVKDEELHIMQRRADELWQHISDNVASMNKATAPPALHLGLGPDAAPVSKNITNSEELEHELCHDVLLMLGRWESEMQELQQQGRLHPRKISSKDQDAAKRGEADEDLYFHRMEKVEVREMQRDESMMIQKKATTSSTTPFIANKKGTTSSTPMVLAMENSSTNMWTARLQRTIVGAGGTRSGARGLVFGGGGEGSATTTTTTAAKGGASSSIFTNPRVGRTMLMTQGGSSGSRLFRSNNRFLGGGSSSMVLRDNYKRSANCASERSAMQLWTQKSNMFAMSRALGGGEVRLRRAGGGVGVFGQKTQPILDGVVSNENNKMKQEQSANSVAGATTRATARWNRDAKTEMPSDAQNGKNPLAFDFGSDGKNTGVTTELNKNERSRPTQIMSQWSDIRSMTDMMSTSKPSLSTVRFELQPSIKSITISSTNVLETQLAAYFLARRFSVVLCTMCSGLMVHTFYPWKYLNADGEKLDRKDAFFAPEASVGCFDIQYTRELKLLITTLFMSSGLWVALHRVNLDLWHMSWSHFDVLFMGLNFVRIGFSFAYQEIHCGGLENRGGAAALRIIVCLLSLAVISVFDAMRITSRAKGYCFLIAFAIFSYNSFSARFNIGKQWAMDVLMFGWARPQLQAADGYFLVALFSLKFAVVTANNAFLAARSKRIKKREMNTNLHDDRHHRIGAESGSSPGAQHSSGSTNNNEEQQEQIVEVISGEIQADSGGSAEDMNVVVVTGTGAAAGTGEPAPATTAVVAASSRRSSGVGATTTASSRSSGQHGRLLLVFSPMVLCLRNEDGSEELDEATAQEMMQGALMDRTKNKDDPADPGYRLSSSANETLEEETDRRQNHQNARDSDHADEQPESLPVLFVDHDNLQLPGQTPFFKTHVTRTPKDIIINEQDGAYVRQARELREKMQRLRHLIKISASSPGGQEDAHQLQHMNSISTVEKMSAVLTKWEVEARTLISLLHQNRSLASEKRDENKNLNRKTSAVADLPISKSRVTVKSYSASSVEPPAPPDEDEVEQSSGSSSRTSSSTSSSSSSPSSGSSSEHGGESLLARGESLDTLTSLPPPERFSILRVRSGVVVPGGGGPLAAVAAGHQLVLQHHAAQLHHIGAQNNPISDIKPNFMVIDPAAASTSAMSSVSSTSGRRRRRSEQAIQAGLVPTRRNSSKEQSSSLAYQNNVLGSSGGPPPPSSALKMMSAGSQSTALLRTLKNNYSTSSGLGAAGTSSLLSRHKHSKINIKSPHTSTQIMTTTSPATRLAAGVAEMHVAMPTASQHMAEMFWIQEPRFSASSARKRKDKNAENNSVNSRKVKKILAPPQSRRDDVEHQDLHRDDVAGDERDDHQDQQHGDDHQEDQQRPPLITQLELRPGNTFSFDSTDSIHLEHFKIVLRPTITRIVISVESVLMTRIGFWLNHGSSRSLAATAFLLSVYQVSPWPEKADVANLIPGYTDADLRLEHKAECRHGTIGRSAPDFAITLLLQSMFAFIALHQTSLAILSLGMRNFDVVLMGFQFLRYYLSIVVNELHCVHLRACWPDLVLAGFQALLNFLLICVLDSLRITQRVKASVFFLAALAFLKSWYDTAFRDEHWHWIGYDTDAEIFGVIPYTPRPQAAYGFFFISIFLFKFCFHTVTRKYCPFALVFSPFCLTYCSDDADEELDDVAMQKLLQKRETHVARTPTSTTSKANSRKTEVYFDEQ